MPLQSRFCVMVLGMGLLAGCQQMTTVTPVATEPDIVTVKLAHAADKAAQALDNIAGIEQQRNPNIKPIEDFSNVPAYLMQPVSVRWSGPVEQISKNLAEQAGMRFRVKGNVPPVPLTVNVDVYQQPIMHVFRNIGLQAGSRADLVIDTKAGVVEVRYAASDMSVH